MIKIFSFSSDEKLIEIADEVYPKHYFSTRSAFIQEAIKHYIRYLKKQDGM